MTKKSDLMERITFSRFPFDIDGNVNRGNPTKGFVNASPWNCQSGETSNGEFFTIYVHSFNRVRNFHVTLKMMELLNNHVRR